MRFLLWFALIFGLMVMLTGMVLALGHQQSTEGEWMFGMTSRIDMTGRVERTHVLPTGRHHTLRIAVPEPFSTFPRSPNGRWIVFPDENNFAQLVRANPDGTQRRVVMELDSTPVYYNDLLWSPDSRWIVVSYAVNTFSSPRLAVARADGEPATAFSFGGRKDHFVWSPDSQWLAFVSTFDFQEGGNVAVVRTRPDGTDYERITRAELEFIAMPHITPDSEWIVLLGLHQGSWNIYRVNILDLRLETLAVDVVNGSLSISPNGVWVAYLSIQSGVPALFRMRPDGSEQAQLTSEGSLGFRAVQWSPDGKRIYILDNQRVHELNVETQTLDVIHLPSRPSAIDVLPIPNRDWRGWGWLVVGAIVFGLGLLSVVRWAR
jgi:dipeptidyl aminopeptidase/acylaminoacyl peptidase